MRNKKKRRIVLIIILIIIAAVIGRLAAKVNNTYEATADAQRYIVDPADGITAELDDKNIIFTPENPRAGFILYPGALVQTEAYAPLMEQLAENGIKTVICGMPHYLAFLDANGAKDIEEKYPEITNWYIGGHSLGGAMAAMYANRHPDDYNGLILLASYTPDDLTDDDIDVLLVRGSEDKIMKMDRYQESLSRLPSDYKEVVIEGGCHGFFGDYGMQDGDGEPTITVDEQTQITLEEIVNFIK